MDAWNPWAKIFTSLQDSSWSVVGEKNFLAVLWTTSESNRVKNVRLFLAVDVCSVGPDAANGGGALIRKQIFLKVSYYHRLQLLQV